MNLRKYLLAACIGLATPLAAQAHNLWLLPSQTVLSQQAWITVDAAVSNDLFYFNHVPLRLDNLVITAPDGKQVAPQNGHTGKYRSVFDVELSQDGTYRLAIVNSGLFASFEDANGERKRWRGSVADLDTGIPADARNVEVVQTQGRIETFVSVGNPDRKALEPLGEGLELVVRSHPNDLFAGEKTTFQLLLDGKPAKAVDVQVIRGNTRYRDRLEEIRATTDEEGAFSVTWPVAGMYWLEAATSDEATTVKQAKVRRATYASTFEVLPQ